MVKDTVNEPLISSAVYAKVSKVECIAFDEDSRGNEYELSAAPTDLTKPYFTAETAELPEARGLTWTDPFFEDEDDVIAVFDLDYEAMESFYTNVGWVCIGLSFLYTPFFLLAMASLSPCYLRKNVQWAVKAKHLAITRDGIRFVEDRRNCGWGFACMDIGKKSKTVPFDKITDCDIVEPAGNECLCVQRVLFKVRIDTASSGNGNHELVLAGLKDPYGFKKLVWAMKRQNRTSPNELSGEGENIATLLREIRDELRQNNASLQAVKDPDAVPELSEETIESKVV